MKQVARYFLMGAALVAAMGPPSSGWSEILGTGLSGLEEVPVITTRGSGAFFVRIHPGDAGIDYVLVYEDLEGGTVLQAHIHLGQVGVAAPIVIHLCGSGDKAACPASPGSLSGTLTGADVVALPSQAVAAGEIGEVVRAIRAGKTYANVHTSTYPSGEVRGQIKHH
jgi:hypothetical protein